MLAFKCRREVGRDAGLLKIAMAGGKGCWRLSVEGRK